MASETVWLDAFSRIRPRPMRWQRTHIALHVVLLLTTGFATGVALGMLMEQLSS